MSQEIKELKASQERIKSELEPYLQAAETNTRGSHVIGFDEPLEVFGTRYSGLQKVRKESKVLNEERVKDWLFEKQNSESVKDSYWDDLIRNSDIFITVRHIDQDVLWDWFVQDYIDEETLNSFFDVTYSYAFLPTKE
jgi:hypothetical protein